MNPIAIIAFLAQWRCIGLGVSSTMKILALLLFLVAPVVLAEQHPSFQLDATAKRKLVEKASALKVGDSFQTVTNALGTPTFDGTFASKESGRRVGRSLKYYAVIWQRGLVNQFNDELVDITLDERGRVRSIYIRVTLE